MGIEIVTAVSENLWDDYMLFYRSLSVVKDAHLHVVGINLSNNYRRWIEAQDVSLTLIETTLEECRWLKPRFIRQIGDNDLRLWIDVDTIIVTTLFELIEKAEKQFTVFYDAFSPQTAKNNPLLYKEFQVTEPTLVINSGVIGCHRKRDAAILKQWDENSRLIQTDERLRKLTAYDDQGCLLLAMQQLGMLEPRMSHAHPDISWNYPAKRNNYGRCDLIRAAINDNPLARIIHYAGRPKLSELGKLE